MKLLNKSQISIFIIVASIILISVIVLINFNSDNSLDNLQSGEESLSNLNAGDLKLYVENCIDEITLKGVYLIGNNGGYIYEYENVFLAENQFIAYHLINNKDSSPSKEFMEEELSKFVKNSLKYCLLNYESSAALDLLLGDGKVNTKIYTSKVVFDFDYPITIKNNNPTLTISKFHKQLDIRLGHILDSKSKILNQLIQDKYNVDFQKLSEYDIEVNMLPHGENIFLISILDDKSNIKDNLFIFNLVVNFNSNSPPRLDFISDFVVNQNQFFSYNLTATDLDNDNLRFVLKESDGFISVDPSGILKFSSGILGGYKYEVCVFDSNDAYDCSNISFIVEAEE